MTKATRTPERMLTVHEVAERLQVSLRTAYSFLDERGLPFIRITPRIRRVRLSDLEAWERARESRATRQPGDPGQPHVRKP